jgi:dihydrofolate synthase/folylpolyglutamate synthase
MTGTRADVASVPLTDYEDALAYLYTLRTFGTKLGLERIRALLDVLGAPDRVGDYLHIAGTNGKGSTAAFLASILRAQGFKTGLFTSPHLVHFSERIRVNGCRAGEGELLADLRRVVEAAASLEGEPPTFFEIVTAMACCRFAETGCDTVVWETGMGGRLDATNAVETYASLLTPIAYDHTRWLGSTLREITGEKAGIMRRSVPAFTNVSEAECLEVISRRAKDLHTTLHQIVRHGQAALPGAHAFVYETTALGQGCYTVNIPTINLLDAELAIRGRAQAGNAALASVVAHWYCTARARPIAAETMRKGLAETYWPARCDVLSEHPLTMLDCAHNGASAEALANLLDEFNCVHWILVFGALADKDVDAVLGPLSRHAKEIWYLKPVSPRGLLPKDFAEVAQRLGLSDRHTRTLADARELWTVLDERDDADTGVLVAGSCYLAGDVMAAREGLTRDIRVDDPHTDRQTGE